MVKNIIKVILNKEEDYINKFHNQRISTELSDYILSESKAFKPNEKIEIHIITKNKMDSHKQKELVDMIRANYGMSVQEAYIISEKSKMIDLLCFLVGIICLFLSMTLDIFPIVSEVLSILVWVLLWEVLYNILFDGLKNRIMIKHYKRLTKCKIVFIENKID